MGGDALTSWLLFAAQLATVLVVLAVAYRPLGDYIAATYTSPKDLRVERGFYRLIGVDASSAQSWPAYLRSILTFSALGILLVYGLQRLQEYLPFALGLPATSEHLAFDTAISFVTNTNWQSYSPDQTLGYTVQAVGLAVQNFVSAAVGIAVAVALIRGLSARKTGTLGNFWVDLTRGTLRILLPFSVVVAVLLMSAGVVQNLAGFTEVTTLAGGRTANPLGPGAVEGKELRFGIVGSTLFSTTSTITSTGAVNSMHDSYTALGGGMAMVNMMLGEVAPGGAGSGLYGILVLAIIAVFVAGLMVGRTPEYLGKKIGPREIKLVSLYILTTPALVLTGTALSFAIPAIRADVEGTSIANPGLHGFGEVLYAFTSAANNNGSAFAGLTANTPWFDTALGVAMLLGRFLPIVFVLALAGSLAAQDRLPATAGTLPTHRPQFVGLHLGAVLIVSALTYFPVLALGPLAEGLS